MVRLTVAAVLAFALSVYAVGDPAGAGNVGNGQGKQFITGGCLSDADCKSKCCAGLKDGAVCSSPDVAFAQGKQGCGFGSAGAGGAGGAGGVGGVGGQNGGNNSQDGGSGGQCDQNGALPSQDNQNDQNDQNGSVPGVPGLPGQPGDNGNNGVKRSLGRKFLA